jgi:hypothetical protein
MTKYIHITVVSPFLSSNEIICESKAVERLTDIRKGFQRINSNPKYYKQFPNAKLSVTTGVVNPELPFIN